MESRATDEMIQADAPASTPEAATEIERAVAKVLRVRDAAAAPDYLALYLERAPVSHAVWRSREAHAMERANYETPLLDLGCGFGEFAGVFFDDAVEIGIDISQRDLALARPAQKYGTLIKGDAHSLPLPPRSLNTVISVSVLEHIANLKPVFTEVHRVLCPGGKFVYTVPTPSLDREMGLPALFNRLGLRFLARWYCRAYHRVFRHVSVLTKAEWERLATEAGFDVERIDPTHTHLSLRLFEAFLPVALPSQLAKGIFGRRLNLKPAWMRRILHGLLWRVVEEPGTSEANIMVVAIRR